MKKDQTVLYTQIKPETRESVSKAFFMSQALKEAKKAFSLNEVPIGAIIVKNNKIISRGFNKREKSKDATCHAEIIAIKNACKKLHDFRLNGCEIFVTLMPCPMCAGAIANARLEKVYVGAKNENLDSELILKIFNCSALNHCVKLESGIMEEECAQIIKKFFKLRRKGK